jgi:hypothetical protein
MRIINTKEIQKINAYNKDSGNDSQFHVINRAL